MLGTGWAATSFLKNLKSNSYEVHVVSPRNYFAFTPLLPSVTNGTVEARSVVEPIRSVVKKVFIIYMICYVYLGIYHHLGFPQIMVFRSVVSSERSGNTLQGS